MEVYLPKKDARPCRRKDKDNPYDIFSVGIDTDSPHFDIVNITLHFFLKDVRSMLPPAVNHSTSVS